MALEVKVTEKQKGMFLLTPEGQINTETHTILEDKIKPLLQPGTKGMILDMAGVDYISSAGLAVIFNTKKFLESNNSQLVLTNLQPQIKKVFDIVKALPNEAIFTSIEEADNYLTAIQRKELDSQNMPDKDNGI
jgi:anti-anti-sigma factor